MRILRPNEGIIQLYLQTYTHSQTGARTHRHTHTHARAHTHTHTYTARKTDYTPTQRHTDTHTYTWIHTHKHTYSSQTHTHTNSHVPTHAHKHVHAQVPSSLQYMEIIQEQNGSASQNQYLEKCSWRFLLAANPDLDRLSCRDLPTLARGLATLLQIDFAILPPPSKLLSYHIHFAPSSCIIGLVCMKPAH